MVLAKTAGLVTRWAIQRVGPPSVVLTLTTGSGRRRLAGHHFREPPFLAETPGRDICWKIVRRCRNTTDPSPRVLRTTIGFGRRTRCSAEVAPCGSTVVLLLARM